MHVKMSGVVVHFEMVGIWQFGVSEYFEMFGVSVHFQMFGV